MGHDLALSNIPEEWCLSTLGEYLDSVGGSIQTGPFGSQLHASDYVKKGIPSVMPKNILVEGINQDDIARISETDAARLSKYRLADGDIVYSRRGDVEKCSLVTKLESGWLCGTGCLRIRLGNLSSRVSPEFIHAYLSSPMIREWISRNAIGATMPNLNTGILRDVPFLLPDFNQSEFIGKSWTVINKKITLNRQINQTLEQMAQALFKSWFVDFDPVVDNALDAGFFEQDLEFPDELLRRAEARKAVRESADFKPLPDDIRQQFPTAFEECSEPSLGLGGWVPERWSHGSIADIASYRAKRVDTLELTLENYISTENMLVDRKGVQPATSLPTVSSVPAYTSGTILVSNIRPYFKKIWLAKGDGGYSNDVLGFETNYPDTEGYLFNLIYQDAFFDFMMATSKGSKMPRGDKKAILGWGLVVPPLSLRLFFSEKVNDFYTSANSRHHENITLNQLRDTLLPKLISGELRLSDIETKIAEEVLI